MIPLAPNQIRLSSKDRRYLAWSNKPDRRHEHIPKYSTLPRVDRRPYKCQSCDKAFTHAGLLKRHAQITHTGTKPVVCEICDRRFSTERHMLAHYNIHNEPRLEEFNVLMKRTHRPARSLPTSFTTVGSFVGVPKDFKTYASSEPTFKSFGTQQSFLVSSRDDNVNTTHAQKGEAVFDYDHVDDTDVKRFMVNVRDDRDETQLKDNPPNKRSALFNTHVRGETQMKNSRPKTRSARRVEFSATSRQYSDTSSTSEIIRKVREAQTSTRSPTRSVKSDKVNASTEKSQRLHVERFSARTSQSDITSLHKDKGRTELLTKLPSLAPSGKSQTKRKGNPKDAKSNDIVKTSAINEAATNNKFDEGMPPAVRTSTAKSLNTRSSFSEAHRQLYSAGSAHFWDAPAGYSESSPTRRMSGVTSISGYDPYRNQSPRKSALRSVRSESVSEYI